MLASLFLTYFTLYLLHPVSLVAQMVKNLPANAGDIRDVSSISE